MGTSLLPKDGAKALSQAELLARLKKTKEKSKANTNLYMAFNGREGRYTVNNGTEEPDTFEKDSEVYLSLFESRQGYVAWKENKVIDSVSYSLFDVVPEADELTDHDFSDDPKKREGWAYQYTLTIKDAKTGAQYELTLANPSSTRAFGALLDEIMTQGAMYDFKEKTPVITLGVEPFKAQGHKNYKPRLELKEWVDTPQPVKAVEDASEEAAEDTTKALPTRKKA